MKITYRPEIDGLRAIAVVSVILYHAKINIFGFQFFNGGFIGVDIFFVISGYLITSIILKEIITKGSFSFKYFFQRRIRRILPLLIFVMFVCLPFAWIYLLPSDLVGFSKSILYSLGFVSNFYFHYSGQLYGAYDGIYLPLLHTWSLSVEEQYYIIFPIILFILFKFFKKYLIHILFFLFGLSLIIADWGSKNFQSLNFYILPTRVWELLAGSILAYFEITNGRRSKNKILNFLLPIIGFFLLAQSILFFNDKMFHPSFYTLSPIVGVCLIIWFSSNSEIFTKILSSKLFVSIGLISYSLYLWHYPIFAFYRYTFAFGSLVSEVLVIIILLIISIFSYFFVEKKFRNQNYEFKKIFIILFFSIFLLALTNFYFVSKNGFPKRSIVDGISIDRNFYLNEIFDWSIQNKNLTNFSDVKKITVVGDSHAQNFTMLFQTNQNLFPNYYFHPVSMKKFMRIVNGGNVMNNEDLFIKNSNYIIFSYHYDGLKLENVKSMIKLIKEKTNKKIILTTVNPVNKIYGSRFMELDLFLMNKQRKPNLKELIKLEKQFYSFVKNNNSYNYFNNELRKLSEFHNIKLLDKSLYQCNKIDQRCKILTDSMQKIHWDAHHHTLKGAQYFGKQIFNLNWLKLN